MAKKWILKDHVPHWLGALSIVIFLAIFLFSNAYLDLDKRRVKELALVLIASGTGILSCLYLGRYMAKVGLVRSVLTSMGQVSLYILIFHNPIKVFFDNVITTTDATRALPANILIKFVAMLAISYLLGKAIQALQDKLRSQKRAPSSSPAQI